MKNKTQKFIKKMKKLLPSTEEKYRESLEFNGEILETVIIEDVFMPEVINLLTDNKEIELLEKVFDYFEEVSNSDDTKLVNNFSVTVLEILGNDKSILETARKYMGSKTYTLQIEADKGLGRI